MTPIIPWSWPSLVDPQDGDTKKAAAVLGLEVARNDLAAPPLPGPHQRQQQAQHGQQAQQQQVILQRIPGDPGQVRMPGSSRRCFCC